MGLVLTPFMTWFAGYPSQKKPRWVAFRWWVHDSCVKSEEPLFHTIKMVAVDVDWPFKPVLTFKRETLSAWKPFCSHRDFTMPASHACFVSLNDMGSVDTTRKLTIRSFLTQKFVTEKNLKCYVSGFTIRHLHRKLRESNSEGMQIFLRLDGRPCSKIF